MPILKFGEKAGAQRGTSVPPSWETTYIVEGEEDGYTVEFYVGNTVSPIIASNIGIMYLEDVRLRHIGYKLWEADVLYGPRQQNLGSWNISGTTTGGTQHILAGITLVAKYGQGPNGQPLPDTLLLGVNPDGPPTGHEVPIPVHQVNISIRMPGGVVTPAFAAGLALLTGCMNGFPWLAWDAGEALYLGADYSFGSDTPTEVVHHLGIQRNLTGVFFAGQTINKRGWDVVTPAYRFNAQANQFTQTIDGVYVHQVHYMADFAAFLGFA